MPSGICLHRILQVTFVCRLLILHMRFWNLQKTAETSNLLLVQLRYVRCTAEDIHYLVKALSLSKLCQVEMKKCEVITHNQPWSTIPAKVNLGSVTIEDVKVNIEK